MTEAQWLTSSDPIELLAYVKPAHDNRKALLLTCACAARQRRLLPQWARRMKRGREHWKRLQDELKSWCAVAEQVAGGARPAEDLEPLGGNLSEAVGAGSVGDFGRIFEVAWFDPEYGADPEMTPTDRREQAAEARLVREVFGNPFRRVRVRRAWQTPAVMSIAAAADRKPTAKRLGQLARALKQAGCCDDRVLEHCRGRRPHVRGCWLVDAILGKS